mmetsp:Transcript_5951/g.5110  ORF Transcript_5951/g.5110 Transcript_5951/m.5110 type:complete len:155 (+) Transcript_5951:213-677(+)
MELEALSLPPHSKQTYITKVAEFKRRYNSSFRELSSLKLGLNNDSDLEVEGSRKVDRYLNNLSRNNNKLRDAIVVGEEAETVARDTKLNMSSNTNKMIKTSDNMGRMNRELRQGEKLIDIIRRNEMKNKLILYIIVVILILAAALIVYFGVFRK